MQRVARRTAQESSYRGSYGKHWYPHKPSTRSHNSKLTIHSVCGLHLFALYSRMVRWERVLSWRWLALSLLALLPGRGCLRMCGNVHEAYLRNLWEAARSSALTATWDYISLRDVGHPCCGNGLGYCRLKCSIVSIFISSSLLIRHMG